MIYLTVRNTSGGNHGHQLKDLIGGITIARIFGFKYVHTYYPYLEFFGLGINETNVMQVPEDLDYLKKGGPFWAGISYENLMQIFQPIMEKYQQKDCLISIENALRLYPFQTINWEKNGLIKNNLFNSMVDEISQKFNQKHQNYPSFYEPNKINVAVHINRGQDYDRQKFPEHFEHHSKVRYMFPIKYWENIFDQIASKLISNYQIHIFTEKLNSEEIVSHFEKREDIVLHLGSNRNDGDNHLIYEIFYHFVKADILVASNSSFSSMATYFRKNKLTIYHPHDHLENLPNDYFLATDESGNFDTQKLKF